MSAIDIQNARQIRDPMLINVGIDAESSVTITCSNFSGWAYNDTNPNASVKTDEWPRRMVSDLQGDGFALDGSVQWYVAGMAGSADNGKLGLLTHIGGSGSFTVSAASEIPALTIYTDGPGTITANGVDYEARGVNVIPVNATSISLTFTAGSETERLTVISVIPGINLSWDQDTLTECTLVLRSDLSMKDPRWAVSEIEIKAYYPDDISEAVTGISDNVPLWYSAGYQGAMSPERRFYLSEPITMQNNILTIKGRDSSYRLTKHGKAAQILNTTTASGRRDLYSKMVHFIEDAGITLRSRQAAPPKANAGTAEYTLIWKSNNYDVIVQNIMNLAHTGTFWPTFVDAGIPRVYHEKPTKKWDIYEEDCGDVQRTVDRKLSKIKSDDDYGLQSIVSRAKDWEEIVRRHCKIGVRYSQNAGGYYWVLTVTNAAEVSVTAESVWWTATKNAVSVPGRTPALDEDGNVVVDKNGKPVYIKSLYWIDDCIVKGKQAVIENDVAMVTASPSRAGITLETTPIAYGRVYAHNDELNTNVFIYPNYKYLFNRSNITGKFKWKGDPRMQPRDVFRFHRLDGSYEDCTIETITLKHSGGGTVAEITYRLGVC